MKIGIITFQFAHNYGAMLQAFSLKNFLCNSGYNTAIIPYYPTDFKKSYSISPLEKGLSIKSRIGHCIRYFARKPESALFEAFKHDLLYEGSNVEFNSRTALLNQINKYDAIVFGSDQIWNTDINFSDPVYFGKDLEVKKISYAASLGSREVSDTQGKFIQCYLPSFYAISVREPESKDILKDIAGIDSKVVCDPVFLTNAREWTKLENEVEINTPYVLVYELQENSKLTKQALDYAKENGLKVFSIHPTNGIYPKGTIPLKKVGPREFLYLIDHATLTCTNSFHCVAFSLIFHKDLIHIPNTHSPERTISLLNRVGIRGDNNVFFAHGEDYNDKHLLDFVNQSKDYLYDALKEYKNNEVVR